MHGIMLMREIREFLWDLPEHERTRRVFDLSQKGDRTMLRAVLSAPTYLTGIDQQIVTDLQELYTNTTSLSATQSKNSL